MTVIEDDVEIQSAHLDRPRHGGRDAREARRQDRQPGAGGARLRGGRGQHHLRADRTGRAASILEKNVLLAGQVGISGHLTIHDNAVSTRRAASAATCRRARVMSGSPAFDAREWLRAITAFPKLPELLKTVRQLEKRFEQLEERQTAQ